MSSRSESCIVSSASTEHDDGRDLASCDGIAPALVGTAILVLIATAMALPAGVLLAIYVSEFAPRRIADQVKLWLDVLNGFPSIVIGIFVFELMVAAKIPVIGLGHHQSAWAGGFALAIIMV